MKKAILTLAMMITSIALTAQSEMRLWKGGESVRIRLADAEQMAFGADGSVTIAGTTYRTADIDSLTMIHQVLIQFSESAATVTIPAAVADEVTATVDGAHVTVTNTNVNQEIEFLLSGESADGSFTYNGSYKTTLRLNGVSLTSRRGAAFDIECGKRIAVILADGTTNYFADSTDGSQKACFYCKGHMELEGSGTLNVTGNLKHAIATKEYLQLKKSVGTINILSAVSDGLHVEQYYQQNGGMVNVTATTLGDGIQVDRTNDETDERNGEVIIKGGMLTMVVANEDCKGIKAEGDITISGGTFNIRATGKGSRGMQTDASMVIGDEDGETSITVSAEGAQCTVEEDADDPHRCMGMKIDGNLTVTGGTTVVTNTGAKSRGIKVAGTYTKTGGSVTAEIKN